MERYLDRLARGLAVVVNILDPDALVLGGGVSNVDEIYTRVPALMREYVFSDTFDTPLLRAAHGDSSGVRGAAMLWPVSATVSARVSGTEAR
jgi:fructokinase